MAICLELSRTPNLPDFTVLSHKGDAMRRLLLTVPVVALSVLLVSVPDASAFGRRKKDCAPDYVAAHAPAPAPAPTCVTWVEQTVTSWQTQWRTRPVPVVVNRPVYREEI